MNIYKPIIYNQDICDSFPYIIYLTTNKVNNKIYIGQQLTPNSSIKLNRFNKNKKHIIGYYSVVVEPCL